MLIYLLKVHFLLLLFVGAYWLLLRNGRSLGLNRFLLLAIIGSALVLPFLPALMEFRAPLPAETLGLHWTSPAVGLASETVAATETAGPGTAPGFAWTADRIIRYLVVVGSLFFLIGLLRQFAYLFGILIRGRVRQRKGYVLVHTEEEILPFSFFRYLVVNPDRHGPGELERIIAHEREHIRQAHYVDVITVELLRVFGWFNPAVWLLGRLVRANLEYLADAGVLATGIDRKSYQYQLLRLSAHPPLSRLITPIHSSPLKKRIAMMNAKKPNVTSLFSYCLLLPALVLGWVLINPLTAQQAAAVATTEGSSARVEGRVSTTDRADKNREIYFVIRKDTKVEVLTAAIETLKEYGVDFSIDNINYNDGEITALSYTYSTDIVATGSSQQDPFEGPTGIYEIEGLVSGSYYGEHTEKLTDRQKNILRSLNGLLILDGEAMTIRGTFTTPKGW